MEFEWEEAKRQSNLIKHSFDFADVEAFDWLNAIFIPDLRIDYGEDRMQAFAMFEGRLSQVTFTRRRVAFRILSFRPASRKERRLYGS